MTPEQISAAIQSKLGECLHSIVLYGSAVGGDFQADHSDYNLLVVAAFLRSEDLHRLMPVMKAWMRSGNPAPVFMTIKQFRSCARVFPAELLDMRANHRTLAGREIMDRVPINPDHLRTQITYELNSTLIRLRESYFMSARQPPELRAILARSFSSTGSLCRAALRLLNDSDPPATKLEAANRLAARLGIESPVFPEIHDLKGGGTAPEFAADFDALFDRYLAQLECILDAINASNHHPHQDR